MKEILVLGAGLVTKPLVDYLLKYENIHLVLADVVVSKAEKIIGQRENGKAVALEVNNNDLLQELVKSSDLVISLLPYTFHPKIAELCLENNKNMVTASYVSEKMRSYEDEAKKRGLLFLNEIGLDPGIDHMSAMKIIDEVKENGGEIVSFESCCGGLPAPDANDNPLGYKFSWSPRGVVLAGRNSAKYLRNGETIDIEGKDLFRNFWSKDIEGLGELEVYPNRDSMIYQDLYGLQNSDTVFRGTFRYPNWCNTLYLISQIGYLDDTKRENLESKTFNEVTKKLLDISHDNVKEYISEKYNFDIESPAIKNIEWLGLFSDEKVDATISTYLDILAAQMLQKMKYERDERDMVVLQHDFIAKYEDKKEKICSLLIDYGIPNGDSAMARTVSLPTAIAAKLIVQGKITLTGIHIPNKKEIYLPVLEELERLGIKMQENVKPF